MKVLSALISCIAFGATVQALPAKERKENECLVLKSVKMSFYGKANHKDHIAYPECSRGTRKHGGGTGTFESPITAAFAPGSGFSKCQVIYSPYLLKYLRFEDVCTDCVTDFAKGKLHIKVWTGNSMDGGEEQLQCIKDLTPPYAMSAVDTPSKALIVDTTPLYKWGAWNPCALDHRYNVINNNAFCFDPSEDPANHVDDERNSVNAQHHPHPRPQMEEQDNTQNQVSDNAQVALQQDNSDTQSAWSLQQDT